MFTCSESGWEIFYLERFASEKWETEGELAGGAPRRLGGGRMKMMVLLVFLLFFMLFDDDSEN